jgi:hypothetical protein
MQYLRFLVARHRGCDDGNHWYVNQGGQWVCQFCGAAR